MGTKNYTLAVLDCETDPFKFGRVPKPFALEFYADGVTKQFWGDDCVAKFADWIERQPERYLIYAHNGGKFDFHFLHDYLDNPIKIIKSRIVSAALFHHTLRDSFAILPVPLGAYNKKKIDYAWFERPRRQRYKEEILEYLHYDCLYLYELVVKFIEQFGIRLTIGGTAMREIKSLYEFERMDEGTDKVFRRFYYGGRVQCFAAGILPGPWKLYDVNSSYPNAMKNYRHPVNCAYDITDRRPRSFKRPYFLRFIGSNDNAIPGRVDGGGLIFTKQRGEFFACSHELEIALDRGLVEIEKVLECYIATETITFADYVDKFYAQKLAAEAAGDKAGRLFAKLLLNSGYGKFGQNPENFLDYLIVRELDGLDDDELEGEGYTLDMEYDAFNLWSRPSLVTEGGLYDVSIAASITSAARATLLEGLQHARNPIYCDTDSIICKSFAGRKHHTELGAWDLEATAKFAAIAGKKMYSLFDTKRDKTPTKLVSKGGTITLKQLLEICDGKTVTYRNRAPTFSLHKETSFVTRKFRQTVDLGTDFAEDE